MEFYPYHICGPTDKAQTSLHICAVLPEPLLLAYIPVSMIVDDHSNQNLDPNMKLSIQS